MGMTTRLRCDRSAAGDCGLERENARDLDHPPHRVSADHRSRNTDWLPAGVAADAFAHVSHPRSEAAPGERQTAFANRRLERRERAGNAGTAEAGQSPKSK